jgi:hypothetical protein
MEPILAGMVFDTSEVDSSWKGAILKGEINL